MLVLMLSPFVPFIVQCASSGARLRNRLTSTRRSSSGDYEQGATNRLALLATHAADSSRHEPMNDSVVPMPVREPPTDAQASSASAGGGANCGGGGSGGVDSGGDGGGCVGAIGNVDGEGGVSECIAVAQGPSASTMTDTRPHAEAQPDAEAEQAPPPIFHNNVANSAPLPLLTSRDDMRGSSMEATYDRNTLPPCWRLRQPPRDPNVPG
jgi:hypothetical protein